MEAKIKLLESVAPNNNPKFEFNHILVDEKYMVATDTIIMLLIKHDEKIEKNCLIINQKAKYKLDADDIIFNKPCSYGAKGYPQYERVVPENTKIEMKNSDDLSFIKCLYKFCGKNNMIIDFVKYAALFKKLDKFEKVAKVSSVDKNSPIKVDFIDGSVFIIIPVIVYRKIR